MSLARGATDLLRKACEEVADGVFVYLSGKFGPNAAFLVGPESVVLIDALMTPRMSRELREAIRRVTKKPVRMTIYTHHHGDHVLGSERFSPPAVVVAHDNCRARLVNLGQEYIPLFASWRRTPQDARDVSKVKRVVYPDITFKDDLSLCIGDLRVELKYLGPAHTNNDIVISIPEREVLILGDLLAYRGVPGMRDARSEGWMARLDEVYAMAPRVIVPGHGQWTEDKSIIPELRDFLATMWAMSKEAYAAHRAPEAVLADLDVSRWEHFHGMNRVHEVVRRMYDELAGEPEYDTSAFRQAKGA
jgi:cyclase